MKELAYLITRYEDVVAALKDPRFSSDTRDAAESNRLDAWWIPKVFTILADSMITNNDPAHQRLRNLVHLVYPQAHRKDHRPRGAGDTRPAG